MGGQLWSEASGRTDIFNQSQIIAAGEGCNGGVCAGQNTCMTGTTGDYYGPWQVHKDHGSNAVWNRGSPCDVKDPCCQAYIAGGIVDLTCTVPAESGGPVKGAPAFCQSQWTGMSDNNDEDYYINKAIALGIDV